jgi:predicted phosphodiesterase
VRYSVHCRQAGVRYVVFSDTHLHQGWDRATFDWIESIVRDADRVIIDGDFWDADATTFSDFVESRWSALFPALKERHAVYLFGNHDPAEACDERVRLFSDQTGDSYTVTVGATRFRIEHGHRFSLGMNRFGPTHVALLLLRHVLPAGTWPAVERILSAILGPRALPTWYRRYNTPVKREWQRERQGDEILVCGHTHAPEMDLAAGFINTGAVRSGTASYLTITPEILELHHVHLASGQMLLTARWEISTMAS